MEKLEEIGEEAIHCLFTYAGDGLFEVEQKKKKKKEKKKEKEKTVCCGLEEKDM
jgi:hypothetical protein